MYPFDNDKERIRKDPFDFFGFDNDFKRLFQNIERMWERAFRYFNFYEIQPGESVVHGFNIRIIPQDKPRIDEFGNRPKRIDEEKTIIPEEHKPLIDVIQGDDDIFITVEVPGVEKEDINLNINESSLEIDVDSPNNKYHKSIDLPCSVIPNKVKTTYKNGILDIVVKRKEKKKDTERYHVDID